MYCIQSDNKRGEIVTKMQSCTDLRRSAVFDCHQKVLDWHQRVLDCDQQRLLSRDPLWRHVHGAGGSSVSVQVKFNLLQMYRSAQ